MANEIKHILGITAEGKSILKYARYSSGLPIAPATSGKTTSVVMSALATLPDNSVATEELSSPQKNPKHLNTSKVNDGGRNLFFRTSPRQIILSEILNRFEMLRRNGK